LVEAHQVPQLSTESGLENINKLDEEAHTSKKKNRIHFLPQKNTFESVSDKRIIKINYYIFYYIFPVIFMYFHHFLFIVLYFS
jgi:hypothetical protein